MLRRVNPVFTEDEWQVNGAYIRLTWETGPLTLTLGQILNGKYLTRTVI